MAPDTGQPGVRADTEPLIRALGARIRLLRRARGLTLAQLATLAGLSHPFLSKLERGLAAPSMTSLSQIARALGTSQVELLSGGEEGPERPAAEVVRADEGATGPYGVGEARLLAGTGRRFQPMECRGDNTDPGDYFTHAEDEFLHVIEGCVSVDMGEEHGTARLEPGDSVYLGGGVPHRWSAAEPGGYRILLVKERPVAHPADQSPSRSTSAVTSSRSSTPTSR